MEDADLADNIMKLNLTADEETIEILSDEVTKTIIFVLLCVVSPTIAVIGVTFNSFSIIVLWKHGLHKCSNILLFSLAIMDISFLIGFNSFPNWMYSVFNGRFVYSETVSFVLYVLYFVFIMIDYGFGLAALCVPMLITIERLVAVYMPLKFGQIITPKRTWASVLGVTLFYISTMVYTCFWYKFEYVFDQSLNRSIGLISKSDLFYDDFDAIPIFEEILFSIKIPPLITVVGCAAIVAKVKVTSQKRSKMTSSKVASTSKTTQTLLVLCCGYLSVCMILAIPAYLPKHLSAYSLTTDNPTNMATIIYFISNILYSCNSSWNFLVYVGFNKNFRDTFREIMTRRFCGKQISIAK